MRRDWRRWIMTAAAVGMTVLAAAGCGKGNTESSAQTETGAQTETTAESAAPETGSESPVIKEFQIVPDFGIVGKNNPQVFVMSEGDIPTVRRDKLVVELENVIYQDGLWIVKTRVQDFSAEIIPKEEAARIAREEKERMNKDGGVERDGYFCYDDARQKYARSLYDDEYGQNISGSMVLMGAGLSESGVRFHAYGASYNYDQLETEGSITYLNDAKAENMKLEQQAPEGTYELKIAGFDEALKFQLKPAQTRETLANFEGSYEIDGLSVVVQKKPAGNLLGVTWMTNEADPYQLSPQTMDEEKPIVLKGEKGEYHLTELPVLSRGMNYDLQGLTKRGQERTLWFDVPGEEQEGTFTLVIPGAVMTEQSTSDPVVILVPEQEEAEFSEEIELNGCLLKLTHIKKMPEPMKTGMMTETKSGEETLDVEVKKPALYVTAVLESKDPEKKAISIAGYKADSSAKDYERHFLQMDYEDGDPLGALKGFYVFYDEGEREIPVTFAYPFYYWHKEIEIPVG